MARRNPVLVSYIIFNEWDRQETKTHWRYKWIGQPCETYGTHFHTFCKTLDPLALMKADYGPTSRVKDRAEKAREAKILRRAARATAREERADTKHIWLHDPTATYGPRFHDFCQHFDPTTPLSLLTGDFVSTTNHLDTYRTTIRDFVAPTKKATNKADELALVASTFLQGEFHDECLYKEIYWGQQQGKGERIIPIVIDTGASISITGVLSDFHE
jgi:hypothetical protein